MDVGFKSDFVRFGFRYNTSWDLPFPNRETTATSNQLLGIIVKNFGPSKVNLKIKKTHVLF